MATPAERKLEWYPGIGYREPTALQSVNKIAADEAAALLLPFRQSFAPGRYDTVLVLTNERVDRLQMAITEAMVRWHERGLAEPMQIDNGNPEIGRPPTMIKRTVASEFKNGVDY